MRGVSVLIPTFRRPDGVVRAVRSVFAQATRELEVVIVDNAPEHSARHALEALAREAPCAFVWGHERRAGVAHARNAALALASGDLIAWLDDDQEAPRGWLAALVNTQRAANADAVFGPVTADAGDGAHAAYFRSLYARSGPGVSGLCEHAYGMGNSLVTRAALGEAPFDPRANETGGEDDRFFAGLAARGGRFAWCAEGGVTEHVDPARLNVRHALKRAFAYGQGPCETAYEQRNYASLARHMGVGAAQGAVFGAAAAGAWALRSGRALHLADRAARGFGKVLWFRPQKFYGAAAS